jgi:cytochrome c553
MKRLLRWIGITLGALVALALIVLALVYVRSERILGRTYPVPTAGLSLPTDAAAVSEGERLVAVRGCFTDCHGRHGEGRVMFDQPMIARIVAPNLTSAVRRYNDAQLGAIIRQGVRPDGRSLLIMPSEAYVALTDEDLGRILAYLRSVPPAEGPGPSVLAGPLGRIGLVAGQFKTAAQLIAEGPAPPPASGEEAALGRYLAWTTCAACHGTDLRGTSNPEFTSPTLQVVAGYSAEAFARLMRTGVALGDRQLPVMGPQARQNLANFTDAEIAALYAYLRALPEAVPHP